MISLTDDLSPSEIDLYSDDAFLNGKLRILQPIGGYKAGIDAVLLASAVSLKPLQPSQILDCGAGVGTVGLCVATRYPGATVTLVEREDILCQLAQRNILRNGLKDRARVVKGDVTLSAQNKDAPLLREESFDYVLANPPYHKSGQCTEAKEKLKDVSNAMAEESLELWIKFAARLTRPGGRYILIHKATDLSNLMALLKGRFGNITIRPIYSNIYEPAIRVLIEGYKGSKGQLQILPPLIFHEDNKEFTTSVNKILREGLGLQEALALSDKEEKF